MSSAWGIVDTWRVWPGGDGLESCMGQTAGTPNQTKKHDTRALKTFN